MSKGSGRLSLGALPRAETVKMAITLSTDLKEQLDAYARAHSELHGPVDTTTLIPHMLAAFMARDRGFRKVNRSNAGKPSTELRASFDGVAQRP